MRWAILKGAKHMDSSYCLIRFTDEGERQKFIRRTRIAVDFYTRKCTPARRNRLVRVFATLVRLTVFFNWIEWRELHMVNTMVFLTLCSVKPGERKS